MNLIELLRKCDKSMFIKIINITNNYNKMVEYSSVGRLLCEGSNYYYYRVIHLSIYIDELWVDVERCCDDSN